MELGIKPYMQRVRTFVGNETFNLYSDVKSFPQFLKKPYAPQITSGMAILMSSPALSDIESTVVNTIYKTEEVAMQMNGMNPSLTIAHMALGLTIFGYGLIGYNRNL